MPIFTGTYGDLLVISLHKIIVNGDTHANLYDDILVLYVGVGTDKLASLYNCFLTIICNISPYCKYLSSVFIFFDFTFRHFDLFLGSISEISQFITIVYNP
jgi:hypothetical protein